MRKLFVAALVGLVVFVTGCTRNPDTDNANNSNRAAANGNANMTANRDKVQRPDGWVTAKIKLALIADGRTSGFATDVETNGGVVTLSGKVDTPEGKTAAEEVAKSIEGVTSVNNQLQVVPDAKRAEVNASDDKINNDIEKAMDSDPVIQELSLAAESNAGVVTLTGEVETHDQLVKAAQVFRKIPGVKSVVTTAVEVAADQPKG